jgi:hypothetical protein
VSVAIKATNSTKPILRFVETLEATRQCTAGRMQS